MNIGNKIYVAGPMRGYPEFNFPHFNEMADMLRENGWDAVNPVDINPDPNTPYSECMKHDIRELLDCDAIYMLEGWGDSQGATLEYTIATTIGLDVYYEGVDYSDEDEEEQDDVAGTD